MTQAIILALLIGLPLDTYVSLRGVIASNGRWGGSPISSTRLAVSVFPEFLLGDGGMGFGTALEVTYDMDSVSPDTSSGFRMNVLSYRIAPFVRLSFSPRLELTLKGHVSYDLYDIRTPWSTETYDYNDVGYGWELSFSYLINSDWVAAPWWIEAGYFHDRSGPIVKSGFRAGLRMNLYFNKSKFLPHVTRIQNVGGYKSWHESLSPYRIADYKTIHWGYVKGRSMPVLEVTYWDGTKCEWPLNKIALVSVGVNKYYYVRQLNYCVDDAKSVVDTFVHFPGYTHIVVETLFNDEVSSSSILNTIQKIDRYIDSTYTLIFYFSGHGYIDTRTNRFYFVMPETRLVGNKLAGDTLSSDILIPALMRTHAKSVLVLIDACHSGGAYIDLGQALRSAFRGSYDRYRKSVPGGRGIAVEGAGQKLKNLSVITAASPEEVAREDTSIKHGIFTYAMLRCISKHRGENITSNRLMACMNEEMPDAAVYVAKNIGVESDKVSRLPFKALEVGRDITIFNGMQAERR